MAKPLPPPPAHGLRCRWAVAIFALGCGVQEDWPGEDERPVGPAATDAGWLGGQVTGADGAPLAGAFVTTDPGGFEAATGADGRFLFARLLPRGYRVVATMPGLDVAVSEQTEVRGGDVANVDVQVGAAAQGLDGVLEVRVVGPDGTPWPGARVVASDGALEVVAESDAIGVARLTGLGGLTVDVSVEDPAGRLWSRGSAALGVPELGGVELAVSLSGRPADGTRTVGTRLCAMCHADTAATFYETAHAESMSEVEGAPAQGFTDAAEIDLGGPVAALGWVDGAPVVVLGAADGASAAFVVSGFIGGGDRGAVPWTERDGTAWPLPVAWVAADPTRPGWNDGGWVAGDLEPWFGADGSFAFADTPAPEHSAEARCFACHASGFTLEDDGAGAVRMAAASGDDARWDEAAVGCERCHGPGEDHTSGPLSEKSLRITNPADLDVDRANEVCAQCHGALEGEAGTPFAWSETHALFLPGEDLADHAVSAFEPWSSGAARVPNAQSDELARSAHGTGAWPARCTDCHDPHGSAIAADLRQESADNTLCLSCHLAPTFGGEQTAVADHARHPVYQPANPPSAGRCTGCHMPMTAARAPWNDASGAGDLGSHLFVAIPPSASLAAFDAAGLDTLPAGAFTPNACQECHAWNEWYFDGAFPGPAGDPSARSTHEALQAAFEEWYP